MPEGADFSPLVIVGITALMVGAFLLLRKIERNPPEVGRAAPMGSSQPASPGLLSLGVRTPAQPTMLYRIEQEGMEPALRVGQYVLLDRITPFRRGDVVVFPAPDQDSLGAPPLIRRIVGLPGDTVEYVEGQVLVNGLPLEEPYLQAGTATETRTEPVPGRERTAVPDGHVYVLADRRHGVPDSRIFGSIPESRVTACVTFLLTPLHQAASAPRLPIT